LKNFTFDAKFSFFYFPLLGEFFVVTILFLHDFTKQYECPDKDRFTFNFILNISFSFLTNGIYNRNSILQLISANVIKKKRKTIAMRL